MGTFCLYSEVVELEPSGTASARAHARPPSDEKTIPWHALRRVWRDRA